MGRTNRCSILSVGLAACLGIGACSQTPRGDGDATATDGTAGTGADSESGEFDTEDSDSEDSETGGTECSLVWEGDFEQSPDGLVGYVEVTEAVRIQGQVVSDLTGMACLSVVGQNFIIDANPALASLDGLEVLTQVGTALRITENPELVDILELSTLAQVGTRIAIHTNPKLASLGGLENITTAMELVEIIDNDSLVDLGGLDGMVSAEELIVGENDSLASLEGVGSLFELQRLNVYQGPGLLSLAGLEAIETIEWQARIVDNPALTDVSGLLGAKVGTIATIEIYGNPMLPQCDAEALAAALQPLDYSGNVEVHTNMGTCP